MQQLPTLLGLQCIVGRIQTMRLCKPFVMRMRGSNIVGRAVKTNTTVCCATFWRSRNKRNVRILIFLLYPSACTTLPTKLGSWLNSLTGFQPFPNNSQQHATDIQLHATTGVQTDATCNIQQCWELFANNIASVCNGLNASN